MGLVCALYGLVQWWPTRTLPYHWDSAAFVIREARDLASNGFLPWVTRTDLGFAHPPTLPTLVALAWQTLGENRLWPHLLMLPLLPMLTYATYLIGRRVGGLVVGIGSAAIVASLPVALAEYGEIYMDLPAAAFATLGLAAWKVRRPRACAALLVAAALCKLPALLVGAVPAVDVVLKRRSPREGLIAFVPVSVTVLVWLYYHHAVTGWWLVVPGRPSSTPAGVDELVQSFRFVATDMWQAQGRWTIAWSVPIAVAVSLLRTRTIAVPGTLGLAVGQVVAVSFFALMGELLTRYLLPWLPMLAVLACALVAHAGGRVAAGVWAVAMVVVQVACWHPVAPPGTIFEARPPADLRYRDYVELGTRLAAYLRSEHPNALVYGAFPEDHQLTEPWQGYVDQPVRFHRCVDFQWESGEQLVIEHTHSVAQRACHELLSGAPSVRLVHAIDVGGTSLRIWMPLRVPPGSPAP